MCVDRSLTGISIKFAFHGRNQVRLVTTHIECLMHFSYLVLSTVDRIFNMFMQGWSVTFAGMNIGKLIFVSHFIVTVFNCAQHGLFVVYLRLIGGGTPSAISVVKFHPLIDTGAFVASMTFDFD